MFRRYVDRTDCDCVTVRATTEDSAKEKFLQLVKALRKKVIEDTINITVCDAT